MSDVNYSGPLNDWMAQAPAAPPPQSWGKSLAGLLAPYLGIQPANDQAAPRPMTMAQPDVIGNRPDVQQAVRAAGAAAVEPFGQLGRVMTGTSQDTLGDIVGAAAGLAPIGPPGAGRALKAGAEGALERLPAKAISLSKMNHYPGGPDIIGVHGPGGEKLAEINAHLESPDTLRVNNIRSSGGQNSLGPSAMRQVMVQMKELYPDVKNIEGFRGTGARSEMGGQDVSAPLKSRTGTLSDFVTAYHGSPHDFDQFDLSKIGTGEGAQAYGHGLYFAENEGVAKQYREKLSTPYSQPEVLKEYFKPGEIVQSSWGRDKVLGYDPETRQAKVVAVDKDGKPLYGERPRVHTTTPDKRDIDATFRARGLPSPEMGKMYQVAIKANPEHFLDWDKPLSEQSDHVQKAIRKAGLAPENSDLGEFAGQKITSAPRWADTPQSTAALREAGIPGIKYRDQGSRQSSQAEIDQLRKDITRWKMGVDDPEMLRQIKAKEDELAEMVRKHENPTRNYVVFDDKLIDILKKYGIAGMAALPAMNAYHFQKSDKSGS